MKRIALLWLCILASCLFVQAQDHVMLAGKFSRRYAEDIHQKATNVATSLNKQSRKALMRLQKQQQKAYSALYKLDSNVAKAYLQNSRQHYDAMLQKLSSKENKLQQPFKAYVPRLDSTNGILQYMNGLDTPDIPGKAQITTALNATCAAGHSLDEAVTVKRMMQEGEQELKALASRYKDLDITRQLKAYNKEFYYYSQRVQQAKETLNDPDKIEKEMMKLLQKNDAFKSWMQQNGQLAQLFGAPGGSSASTLQNLAGLQTRQSVQQGLQSRFGNNTRQVQQFINTGVQAAQAQLSSYRNRLQQLSGGSLGNGGGGSMNMPDFKPNNQKTKPFLKRLEYGVNLQSNGGNRWFPATTDIGLSLGYKLNDKSVIGIGAAYKLGWGKPISHIRVSHQGIGVRSYMDYQLKGSIWLSGGYEQNYRSAFNSISELQNRNAWQSSGLIGLNKKMKSGKRTVETKLLWDFLSYRQIPKTQALLFRVEYKL